MTSKLRNRLTYANVMATIAVFVALGGSSYAAIKVTSKNVPKNALTGADIKNLTGQDVRNNSLTGADVRSLGSADVANGGLLAEDFAPGQLPAGPKGDQGPEGREGPKGDAGATNATVRTQDLNPGGDGLQGPVDYTAGVACFPGERAVGGGARVLNTDHDNYRIIATYPGPDSATPTSWSTKVYITATDSDAFIRAYAVCVAP